MYFSLQGGRVIRDYWCSPVRGFVNGCINEKIPIGFFPTEKKHSYSNLAKAVNDLEASRGVPPYERLKFLQKAKVNLDRLFERISEFQEHHDVAEMQTARTFFEDNKRDMKPHIAPGATKDSIPEDHDLEFLVSTHNLADTHSHILSDDAHFWVYADIIPTVFNVEVIAMKDLNGLLDAWSWPHP